MYFSITGEVLSTYNFQIYNSKIFIRLPKKHLMSILTSSVNWLGNSQESGKILKKNPVRNCIHLYEYFFRDTKHTTQVTRLKNAITSDTCVIHHSFDKITMLFGIYIHRTL